VSIYFSGIISGIDTEELIRQLMNIERRPIRLMQQKVSRIEEQQSAWRDVNHPALQPGDQAEGPAGRQPLLRHEGQLQRREGGHRVGPVFGSAGDLYARRRATGPESRDGGCPLAKDWTLQAGGTLELQVGDGDVETITLQAGASLHEVAKAINEQAKNVRASVVNVDGENLRLVLEGVATGEKATIAFAGTDEALLQELGLTNPEELQKAQDARFTLNGLVITRSTNEISDAIEGVTFTLRAVGATTITVSQDLDGIVDKIKAVVDQYNSFYTFSQEKLAKDAVLQGDSALIQLVSRVRSALTEPVGSDWTGGGLNQLALIGITTTREGTLTVDETVLREKLAEDPLAVQRLFTAKEDGGVTGVAQRAVDLIQQYTRSSGLISSRQNMYRSMIDDINDQIDSLELRLQRREETMRAQFIRMEQMLATLNAQATALAGQLAQISAIAAGGGSRGG